MGDITPVEAPVSVRGLADRAVEAAKKWGLGNVAASARGAWENMRAVNPDNPLAAAPFLALTEFTRAKQQIIASPDVPDWLRDGAKKVLETAFPKPIGYMTAGGAVGGFTLAFFGDLATGSTRGRRGHPIRNGLLGAVAGAVILNRLE